MICLGFRLIGWYPDTKKSMYWQTSLLCIVVKLAGGGFVAVNGVVAVAVVFLGFHAHIRTRREIQWSPVFGLFLPKTE